MDLERVVVLGDSGLIGNAIRGRFESRLPAGAVQGRSMPEVDLREKDHMDRLADLFDRRTAVVMCAGVKRQWGDSPEIFLQNVQMVVNVCRLLQKRPVGHFVYFSSAAVYGEDVHNTRITEETPVCSRSYYGVAKFASEGLLRKTFSLLEEENLLILRPPLVYGPGDSGNFYSPSGFLKTALSGQPVVVWGDGMEKREFIFVEDVAEIVCRLTFGRTSGVFNLASGRSNTFAEVLEIIPRLIGRRPEVVSRQRTKEKVDNVFLNNKIADQLPGFHFRSLEEGLRETWNAVCPTLGGSR